MPKPPKPRRLKRVAIPVLDAGAVGKRIKSARKHRHWTQKDVAYLTGVYPSCLSHWETGRRVPPIAALVALATVLRRTMDWLTLGKWVGKKRKLPAPSVGARPGAPSPQGCPRPPI